MDRPGRKCILILPKILCGYTRVDCADAVTETCGLSSLGSVFALGVLFKFSREPRRIGRIGTKPLAAHRTAVFSAPATPAVASNHHGLEVNYLSSHAASVLQLFPKVRLVVLRALKLPRLTVPLSTLHFARFSKAAFQNKSRKAMRWRT